MIIERNLKGGLPPETSKAELCSLSPLRFILSIIWNYDENKGYVMLMKILVTQGEDGYFVAHCPSLKSCWSQGKTKPEALQNIREAIELFLEPDPIELSSCQYQELIELTV
jgi:predicted RNase H-like HicB family nuclease